MNNTLLPDLLNKYLQYCQVIRNYSPITISSYRQSFDLFFRETKINYVQDLNKAVLEKWFFEGRLKRQWKSVTFRHHHKRLNTFFKWLIKEKYLSENYVAEIEKPKVEHTLPRTLTKDEAQLVLDASFHLNYCYKFEKFRNRAIIGFMVLAGLRRKEVINLKLNEVSLENRTIFINQGKGSKDRIVPINSKLHSILTEYLKDRTRLNKSTIYFLTSIQKDLPIGIRCINNLVFKLRQQTKVNFSAHTLRHGFARLMIEGGCDIYTLSKIMGHSKITTTTIYLACSSQQMSKSIEMHSLN